MSLKKVSIILVLFLFLFSACQEPLIDEHLTVKTRITYEDSSDQYVDEYDLVVGEKHTLRNAAPYDNIRFEITHISDDGITIKTDTFLSLFNQEERSGDVFDEFELEFGAALDLRTIESGWGAFYTFELSKD